MLKVKIGDKIYDSADEPIMIILGEDDKHNIENMLEDCSTYMSYPDGIFETDEDAFKWMKTKDNE